MAVGGAVLCSAVPLTVAAAALRPRPHLVITLIAAAFAACVSVGAAAGATRAAIAMGASVVTRGVVAVASGVLASEAARFGLWRALEMAERSARAAGMDVPPLRGLGFAVAVGAGFAATHSIVVYGGAVLRTSGPLIAVDPACPLMPSAAFVSIVCAMFSLLHVAFSLLVTAAYRDPTRLNVFVAVALRVAAPAVTLLHSRESSCVVSLPSLAALCVCGWLLCSRAVRSGALSEST